MKTTAAQMAASYRRSQSAVHRRCRNALRALVGASDLPKLATTDVSALVLVVDGMWCRFRRLPWVLYNMAVKPIDMPTAFFLDPVLIPGRESGPNWEQALATIPPAIGGRIRAIVTDGFSGHKRAAGVRGWLVQRCHRHLEKALWGVHTKQKCRLRGGEVRKEIYGAAMEIRSTPDRGRVAELYQSLRRLAAHPDISARIRGTVRRTLYNLASFRTYLDYPELHLPTTTNAVESRNSLLRRVLSCVNSPAAALLRARAYTRLHPTITCNGPENPQE